MSSSDSQSTPRQSAIIRRGTVQMSPFASLARRPEAHHSGGIVGSDRAQLPCFVPLVGPRSAGPESASPIEAPRNLTAEEVDTILRDGRRQAAEVVANAHEQGQTIREAALRDGQAEGYRAGKVLAETEIGESARVLNSLVEQARIDYRGLLLAAERQVADLAVAVAQKVLERELATDDTIILNIVRAALHEVEDVTAVRVRVRVNPAYQPTIAMYWHNEGSNVEFVGDPDLALGDCMIDSDAFGLDARVGTRMAELSAALEATLDARRGDAISGTPDAPDAPEMIGDQEA
jgi:flagellar biosynthesis/type III secretory pathway protein FliH